MVARSACYHGSKNITVVPSPYLYRLQVIQSICYLNECVYIPTFIPIRQTRIYKHSLNTITGTFEEPKGRHSEVDMNLTSLSRRLLYFLHSLSTFSAIFGFLSPLPFCALCVFHTLTKPASFALRHEVFSLCAKQAPTGQGLVMLVFTIHLAIMQDCSSI